MRDRHVFRIGTKLGFLGQQTHGDGVGPDLHVIGSPSIDGWTGVCHPRRVGAGDIVDLCCLAYTVGIPAFFD